MNLYILIVIMIILFIIYNNTYKKEQMTIVGEPQSCLVKSPTGLVYRSNSKNYKCDNKSKCYLYKCINNYNGIVTNRNEPCWIGETYYK